MLPPQGAPSPRWSPSLTHVAPSDSVILFLEILEHLARVVPVTGEMELSPFGS